MVSYLERSANRLAEDVAATLRSKKFEVTPHQDKQSLLVKSGDPKRDLLKLERALKLVEFRRISHAVWTGGKLRGGRVVGSGSKPPEVIEVDMSKMPYGRRPPHYINLQKENEGIKLQAFTGVRPSGREKTDVTIGPPAMAQKILEKMK